MGEKTPVFVRFSTVTFGREFPDEGRNPRGFAIKFYTMEGNYDIVGLNFVRDQVSFAAMALTLLPSHSLFSFAETLSKALT